MAKNKVSDQLVDVLPEVGIRQMYGVSGDSLNGITDSIRARKQIQWAQGRSLWARRRNPRSRKDHTLPVTRREIASSTKEERKFEHSCKTAKETLRFAEHPFLDEW